MLTEQYLFTENRELAFLHFVFSVLTLITGYLYMNKLSPMCCAKKEDTCIFSIHMDAQLICREKVLTLFFYRKKI